MDSLKPYNNSQNLTDNEEISFVIKGTPMNMTESRQNSNPEKDNNKFAGKALSNISEQSNSI
jgi:hypothetical protein